MITLFDHVFSPLRDNDLDSTLVRFERAGFLIGPRKVRHSCGRLTGFALMTASYLEFTSVVNESDFAREAAREDRYFRIYPQPYGVGICTNDARSIYRKLETVHPDIPPLMQRGEAGSRDRKTRWTFCWMPPKAFPGANVFAVQYHGRRRARPVVRHGPNTIFALGGLVFCSGRISESVAAWKRTLGKITRVASDGARLRCGGQQFEWISYAEYRRRTGRAFEGLSEQFGGISAVKLLCADLREACRWLTAQDFRCVAKTDIAAYFAPDAATGYTFELIQENPAKFVRRLVDKRDSKVKARREHRPAA